LSAGTRISCSQLSRLESGECDPRPVTACVLAVVLDTPEQVLFADLYAPSAEADTSALGKNHDLDHEEGNHQHGPR
jgi:transcriptional regulator with XRE-family HTH domain